MDRCDRCGFVYDLRQAPTSGPIIVRDAAEVARMLSELGAQSRARSEPETWSPLEYGCHVRDVLLVQRERVLAARRTVLPSFEPMGREERVAHDGYADQSPDDVARQLTDAAAMFANVLSLLDAQDWDRRVMYNYPERLERSLQWMAVHTQHELQHHLLDVRNQLEPARR